MKIIIESSDTTYHTIELYAKPNSTVITVEIWNCSDPQDEEDKGIQVAKFEILVVELIAALQTLSRLK